MNNLKLKKGNLKDDNILDTKSVAFALRIINAYKYMINEKQEFIMSKQMLRSGTAIGALVKEADYISDDSFVSIQADYAELIRLLVSIIKTSRGKS